jgi:hypothetical protein
MYNKVVTYEPLLHIACFEGLERFSDSFKSIIEFGELANHREDANRAVEWTTPDGTLHYASRYYCVIESVEAGEARIVRTINGEVGRWVSLVPNSLYVIRYSTVHLGLKPIHEKLTLIRK